MAILKNKAYPHLNLFTGVTSDSSGNYGNEVGTPASSRDSGISAIWVLYKNNAPFSFKNYTGWMENINGVTHLDFGFFNPFSELAFGSNKYIWPLELDYDIVTNPYNAVRCVEK